VPGNRLAFTVGVGRKKYLVSSFGSSAQTSNHLLFSRRDDVLGYKPAFNIDGISITFWQVTDVSD